MATRPKVLVVDDEVEILDLCRRLLGQAFEVATVRSAGEGLALAHDQSFCVAIVDQGLVGIDGIEFLSQLQSVSPDTARVIITGSLSHEKVLEAINRGKVHSYILKPWKAPEFNAIVRREAEMALLRRSLVAERERYRQLVFDDTCHLPTRHLIEEEAAVALSRFGSIGALVIDASELWSAETNYGAAVASQLKSEFLELLTKVRGRLLRNDDVWAVDEVGAARFCVLLTQPRTERLACSGDVGAVARRLQESLSTRVLSLALPESDWWPQISVGHGFVLHNPNVAARHQVRNLVQHATDQARRILESGACTTGRDELERIISCGDLVAFSHAIVDLATGEAIGVEMLSRGPLGTDYEKPLLLLRMAARIGLEVELDRAFRTVVFSGCCHLPKGGKYFVNILPQTFADPAMGAEQIVRTLEKFHLEPGQVVFEVSERSVIHNRAVMRDLLRTYQALGIGLAIDDVGVGYSGLERIVELKPNFVKIDISLIRDLHTHLSKQSAVAALTKMAHDVGAVTIAEGIEKHEERDCLLALDVPLGQGFLWGRPGPLSPNEGGHSLA